MLPHLSPSPITTHNHLPSSRLRCLHFTCNWYHMECRPISGLEPRGPVSNRSQNSIWLGSCHGLSPRILNRCDKAHHRIVPAHAAASWSRSKARVSSEPPGSRSSWIFPYMNDVRLTDVTRKVRKEEGRSFPSCKEEELGLVLLRRRPVPSLVFEYSKRQSWS